MGKNKRSNVATKTQKTAMETQATAMEELVLPYASTVSIRSWAKPRNGSAPRRGQCESPESGYNSRASSASPLEDDGIYDKEYVWGSAAYNHDEARAKIAVMTPQKQRSGNREDRSTTPLMEVLEAISSTMAESGSWTAASRVAQDQAVIKRVQGTLDATGILPDEASATELLTALLSCFEE